ncbi:hypothetical protein [Paenibacillus macerans]|uniref:hypothetical protein n=1 Tax=Paenibacillus macerans TaxID=44252 RepID=UPI003D31ECA3
MIRFPDAVRLETGGRGWVRLDPADGGWAFPHGGIRLEFAAAAGGNSFAVKVSSPSEALSRIQLSWKHAFPAETAYLGDAFERGYGDLGFEPLRPDRILPWYFIAAAPGLAECYGVMTGPNALCHWQVNDTAIDLWMDIRNGTYPIELGERELEAATVVFAQHEGVEPFEAAAAFCRAMCPRPRLPAEPVHGGNDWYYAYGNNSAELIAEHAELVALLSQGNAVRPFMVIDNGWQPEHAADYNGGPWDRGNVKFGSMAEIAGRIKELGVRPGIWFRPLLVREAGDRKRVLHADLRKGEYVLDPSDPEVLRRIGEDVSRIVGWGYELIKHDFTTVDLFGRWGFQMDLRYTDKEIRFCDKSKTTAQIIKAFYQTIREHAGKAYIIGCNTIGHLAAGIFELQRTGDDTSGKEFARTRKMGVNTLAFRMPQHQAFYLADADCVGIAADIPWEQNREWLKAVAHSGTPLFISCNPRELTEAMRADLREAFALAATPQPSAVPLDWLSTGTPSLWRTARGVVRYEWYGYPRAFE